jgi:hypothetical protein
MAVAIESGIDHTELDSVSIAASEASFDTADSDDTSLSGGDSTREKEIALRRAFDWPLAHVDASRDSHFQS